MYCLKLYKIINEFFKMYYQSIFSGTYTCNHNLNAKTLHVLAQYKHLYFRTKQQKIYSFFFRYVAKYADLHVEENGSLLKAACCLIVCSID